MKRCTKVVLSLVLLLCVAGIAVPLGISKYYDTYGEYYYKTLIVSKDDAAKADKKISEVRDCGDFSIVKYKSMKATGEAVSDLYSENSKPFIIDTDMSLNAGLIEDVDASEIVEKTNLPAKSDEDIIVAVVDTGFDQEQSPYADRVVEGIDLTGTGAMTDQNGHGTLMTNTILQYSGQNVKVMPVKVMADDGCRTSTLFEGMLEAVDSGADIVNVSMSSLFVESGDYSEQICAYAKSKNVPIVIAAGNNNMNTYSTVPANNYSGIVVSALDENNKKAGYSNNGDNVDVCSYGAVNVYNKYSCGTSVSAALVSSTLADNMKKGYTIGDFESLIGKLAKPMGEPEEVVTYGLGLIVPEDFEVIVDEQSVLSEAGKIYNIPWRGVSDTTLDYYILCLSSDYEVKLWLDSLSEEDLNELLDRNTVLNMPMETLTEYRGNFVEDGSGDLLENVAVNGDNEKYITYYDYYKDIDLDTVSPVCAYTKLVVKLRHRYNKTFYSSISFDSDDDVDDETDSGTTFTYYVFNPTSGTEVANNAASKPNATANINNKGKLTNTVDKTHTLIGGDFTFCDKQKWIALAGWNICTNNCANDSNGTVAHRHLVSVDGYRDGKAFLGLDLLPYSFVQISLQINKNMTVHSKVSIKSRTSPEGNILDILDNGEAYPNFACTHDAANIKNLGFQVGVCKSCEGSSGVWEYNDDGTWKKMPANRVEEHESDDGTCRYGGKSSRYDSSKDVTYHVDGSKNTCRFRVVSTGDHHYHGPFNPGASNAYGKDTFGNWNYPMFTVLTQSNELKGSKNSGGCNYKTTGKAVCKVCSKAAHTYTANSDYHVSNYTTCKKGVIDSIDMPMVFHEDEGNEWDTAHKSSGDYDSQYKSWICGRTSGWKKSGGGTKNCDHQMLRQIDVRHRHRYQRADGLYDDAYSNYAYGGTFTTYVGTVNNKGLFPTGYGLSPNTPVYSEADTSIYTGGVKATYVAAAATQHQYKFRPYKNNNTVLEGVGNPNATNQSLSVDVARKSYNLNISVRNDTPYPAVTADKIVTITGTATDSAYAGGRPVVLGTVPHLCSGGGKAPEPSVTINKITATATVAKGYKFVGWYFGRNGDESCMELISTNPTCEINMPDSNAWLQARVVGVTYKVRLYGNKLPTASTEIRNINPNGFVYQVRAVNTVNGPMTVDPKDYLTWNAIKVGQLINGVPNDAFFYTTTFQVGNAACALPSVSQYCYELPGYEPVKHTTTVYPNVAEGAVQDNPNAKVKNLIQHIDWDWHLYVGNDPVTGQKGSEAAHPFKDTTGTYQNGIYKGSNTATPGVQSWDLQLTESGYADLYPVWTPIEYGIYYDKNGRGADDRRAGDLVLVDGATGGYNPFSDSFDDVLMVYQFDQTYQYPESRWTRARGWGDSIFTGWSDRDTAIEPGSKRSAANFMWDWEAGDEFTNLTKICGTDYHRYAIFNDKPYVKAKDIYDRNGNVAKLAQEMPGEDGKYIVSKSKLEEYILTMKQPVDRTDTKNQYFRGEQPAYWWDRELGTFELGNYDEPGTFQSFGGKTRYWIEFIELEDMGNISGVDKDFMDANPDYIVVDPSEHDVVTFEIHYSIQDELKNYYTVTQKLYAGFWTKIDVDVN